MSRSSFATHNTLPGKPRGLATSAQDTHGLFVEGDKRRAAKLCAFESNDAIGEVSAGFEERETRLSGRTVHGYVVAGNQTTNGKTYFAPP